ncbi:hypothetical protein [Hymenobacter sp. PAMC 26628]|uniref:hypothetical protein n=1 Tax=Hymenobacter sp. PAMC 26628 TaxID=1484118 RepID=UPI000A51006A|nr:hypothetical protein [Hymenobacter sp. PAMC 26628]
MDTNTPTPKVAAATLPLAATRAGNGNPSTAPKRRAVAKARGFMALPNGPRMVVGAIGA